MDTYNLSLRPLDAANIIRSYVENSGITSECVMDFRNGTEDGAFQTAFLIFEKYMMRNSSRVSLSVALENLSGVTHLAVAGSGGGESALFKFDWGSANKMQRTVLEAIGQYVIQ
jgi:hypothetical protein